MKYLSFALKITLLALMPMMVMTSCDKDDPEPTTAKISGTITFEETELWNTWKDSGEIQLTIFPAFTLDPQAGWGDVPENFFPGFLGGRLPLGAPSNAQNPIIIDLQPGVTEYNYTLTVEPGTYSALAVGFRHDFVTNPSLRTATLGVHHSDPNTVSSGLVLKVQAGPSVITVINDPAPTVFTVEAGDEVTIDFKADLGFVTEWRFR